MKATGIVRRIDDLGRIVIPKEIRRTLRIRETDPLEIFTDKDGDIVLKKYSPIAELSTIAKEYTESIAQSTGHTVCVSDRDQIIAASGPDKKEVLKKNITKNLEDLLEERRPLLAMKNDEDFIPIVEEDGEVYGAEAMSPIICAGDVLGAVIIMTRENRKRFSDTERMLAMVTANVIGRQMEVG